ncbi:MAG: DUF896 domain-containing protein [Clostridia bacterium]|nr:DUF896 domain-containing protein [Clostridia bacterium]MBR4458363.1 DUF896 domain-containing protein [Clostridia bacterium]
MEHKKIERINELARKKKTEGLTPAEVEEQAALRREYLQEFRKGMEAMLEGVVLKRPDGTLEPLSKKPKGPIQ